MIQENIGLILVAILAALITISALSRLLKVLFAALMNAVMTITMIVIASTFGYMVLLQTTDETNISIPSFTLPFNNSTPKSLEEEELLNIDFNASQSNWTSKSKKSTTLNRDKVVKTVRNISSAPNKSYKVPIYKKDKVSLIRKSTPTDYTRISNPCSNQFQGLYYIIECFYGFEPNAINRKLLLQENGFNRANYIYTPCFTTDVKKNLFATYVEGPFPDLRKANNAKIKLMNENAFPFKTLRILYLQKNNHS